MKKFFVKILLFFVVLTALDIAAGFAFRFLVKHAKGGDTGLATYIADKMQEECIIFGSSRGMHHYDPNIIGDSLGMSCWNCSRDGNGIIMMYGRYLMLSERYTPKVLIYDVHIPFDLQEGDNHTYLGSLRYFYDRPGVDSIFWAVDGTERYKMLSQLYRCNSQWLQLISDNIHPQQHDDKGYRPMDLTMEYEPKVTETEKRECHYDSLKLNIQQVNKNGNEFEFKTVNEFHSDYEDYALGYHTFNIKNGLIVVDGHRYRFPIHS